MDSSGDEKLFNFNNSFEKDLNINVLEETYEEEEVFFGPVTDKEKKLMEKWKNRRTEYYSPSRLLDMKVNGDNSVDIMKKHGENSNAPESEHTTNMSKCESIVSESSSCNESKTSTSELDISLPIKNALLSSDSLHNFSDNFNVSNKENSKEQKFADSQLYSFNNIQKKNSLIKTNLSECLEENLNIDLHENDEKDVKVINNKTNCKEEISVLCDNKSISVANLNFNIQKSHLLNSDSLPNFSDNVNVSNEENSKEQKIADSQLYSFKKNIQKKNSLIKTNLSECTEENLNIDLHEKDVKAINGKTNYKGEPSVVCDNESISVADKNESDLNFKIQKSLVLKTEIATLGENDLNKKSENICKRESYFSSLPMINVHNETMGDLISDSFDNIVLISNLQNIKEIEEGIENETNEEILSKFSEDSLEKNGSYCEIPSPASYTYVSTNNSEIQSLPDQTFDSTSLNNCKLYSQSLSLKDSSKETSCSLEQKDISTDNDNLILKENNENQDLTPDDSFKDYPDTPPSFSPPSPDHKFNDTIEEMELLLSCGINYFEDLVSKEESVCTKEQTISSSNSVHSFNPNFDSTRASCDEIKEETNCKNTPILENRSMGKSPNMTEKEIEKKMVPSKPPRIIISKPSPKVKIEKLPLHCSSQKNCTNKYPNYVHSPVVKTVTKSKIESFNLSCEAVKNNTHLNTPQSQKFTPTTQKLKVKNFILSTPTSSKFSSKYSGFCCKTGVKNNTSKIPKITSPLQNNNFRTPQSSLPRSVKIPAFKSVQASRQRTLNIISPVAKYLQDNPPPPLIATVRPRYKLSPSSSKLLATTSTGNTKNDFDSSYLRREERFFNHNKAVGNKMTSKSPLKESNNVKKIQSSKSESLISCIPPSVHTQGEGILVNKENLTTKRTVPSGRPPIYILKHKGRMKLPKNAMVRNDSVSPSCSNKHLQKLKSERFNNFESENSSLMEVSVYEQHIVRHSNTLK